MKIRIFNVVLFFFLLVFQNINAQQFIDINAEFPDALYGTAAWADYDNDGDLDVIVSGQSGTSGIINVYTDFFKNEGDDSFTQVISAFPFVKANKIYSCDFNNDNYLDAFLVNDGLYKNNGDTTFTKLDNYILQNSDMAWGDYNNDGKNDFVLSGEGEVANISEIYQNYGATDFNFINQTGININGVSEGRIVWGDYDNDGDLDILMGGSGITKIYKNTGNNTFAEQNDIILKGISDGAVAWGDYDNDGDLDILIAGASETDTITEIYKNNGDNTFTEQSNIQLTGVIYSAVAWGDYDNDGNLDILLSGESKTGIITKIYKNNGDNTFSEQTDISITGIYDGVVFWGDYDNDDDLDILLQGTDENQNPIVKIYKNTTGKANTKPSAPANLHAVVNGNTVLLSWDKATDTETPQNGLSYTIYVGTSSKGFDVCSPQADITTGLRKIVTQGAIQTNSFELKDLNAADYYWSVQAVDAGFAGSSFATEGSFTIAFDNGISPTDQQDIFPGQTGTTINVDESEAPDSRQWKYALVPGGPYTKIIAGETASSYTPGFDTSGVYYIVCESVKNGVAVVSNEVKIDVLQFIEKTNIGIDESLYGYFTWGDYNNDNYLDLLFTGNSSSKVYKNNGDNTFSEQTGIVLPSMSNSSADWGDFNNDDYLDILLTGSGMTKIYTNNGDNTFTELTNSVLAGISEGNAKWIDFDKDGDLDFIIAGYNSDNESVCKLYINKNGIFSLSEQYFKGGQILDIADYNNDQYPDVLIAGKEINGIAHTTIYKNNGDNTFSEQTEFILPPISDGSAIWGDYDNDGYPDILICGNGICKICRNNTASGNGFSEMENIKLPKLIFAYAAWGDYNNDGNIDILFRGVNNLNQRVSRIYKNEGTPDYEFIKQDISITGTRYGFVSWGDYDNDNDLDFLLSGYIYSAYTHIYENISLIKNTKPSVPANLSAEVQNNTVNLAWDKSTDQETPSQSISYNISVGKTSGSGDIINPMADKANGYRKIVNLGNTFYNNKFELNNLETGTYYWSVQSIDNTYGAAGFSTEQTFEILPPFSLKKNLGLDELYASASASGDFDNDGDLDLLINGDFLYVFINRGDYNLDSIVFETIPLTYPAFAWGDYDNNGCLDFILCSTAGYGGFTSPKTMLYKNEPCGTLIEQEDTSLLNLEHSSVAWGDYNNDGKLDLLLTGNDVNETRHSLIYKNNGDGTFTEQPDISLPAVSEGSVAWGDYDKDGDLDILLTGQSNNEKISKIFRNNGDNTFTEQTNIDLTAVSKSSVAWGDYDSDGDLDILLSGYDSNDNPVLNIYKNNGNNTFSNLPTLIRKVGNGSVAWGDFNNDGFLDIFIFGESGSKIAKIYQNNQNDTFTELDMNFPNLPSSYTANAYALGDYDNDRDLDFFLVQDAYNNNTNYPNNEPTAPGNLKTELDGFDMKLSWDKAQDPDSPNGTLYYNLRIGTTSGGEDVMTPMANLTTGYRKIPAIGNAQCDTFWIIKDLIPGQTYYWSVQAIDQSFTGGEWAAEQSFTLPELSADFTADTVCFGTPTTFTDKSLSEGEEITSWLWDFGDENSSAEQNPKHTYELAGTYTVTLRINSASYEHQITKDILVKEKPVADFDIIKKGDLVCQFINQSSLNEQPVAQWIWNFGDDSITYVKNPPLYNYSNEGIYNVSLYVETENGCSDTLTKTNIICGNLLKEPELYVRGPNVWYFACSNDSADTYRWYRNGELIPDADNYIYVANQNLGTYYVEINNGGVCWVPSETITIPDDFYNGTAKKLEQIITDMPEESAILSYPNPNNGTFTLLFKSDYQGKIYIRIKNLSGQTLRQYYADKNTSVYSEDLDLKALGKGVYFVEIEYGGKKSNSKIVIE